MLSVLTGSQGHQRMQLALSFLTYSRRSTFIKWCRKSHGLREDNACLPCMAMGPSCIWSSRIGQLFSLHHPSCLHLALDARVRALQISGALLSAYGMWKGVTRKPSCTTYRCNSGQATITGHVQTLTLTPFGKVGIPCSCLVFRSMSHLNSWKRCIRSPLGWMTIY